MLSAGEFVTQSLISVSDLSQIFFKAMRALDTLALCRYYASRLGGVAQLVERLNGIQEVRGSIPLTSTGNQKAAVRQPFASLQAEGN